MTPFSVVYKKLESIPAYDAPNLRNRVDVVSRVKWMQWYKLRYVDLPYWPWL